MSEYRCSTCDSGVLVIRAKWVAADVVWEIACGNGHIYVPTPSTEIVVAPGGAAQL